MPIGDRSERGSRGTGISELRRRELEQEAAEDAAILAAGEAAAIEARLVAARALAAEEAAAVEARLAAARAEAKARAARRATELARTSSNAHSQSHAGDLGSIAATGQLHPNAGADGNTPAPHTHVSARDTPSLPQVQTTAPIERPRADGSIGGNYAASITGENLPPHFRCLVAPMPGASHFSFAPTSQGPMSLTPEAGAQFGA